MEKKSRSAIARVLEFLEINWSDILGILVFAAIIVGFGWAVVTQSKDGQICRERVCPEGSYAAFISIDNSDAICRCIIR
jgi:hypothetical protein